MIMIKEVEVAGRRIGPGHPCFIIAEAGVNHNGDLHMAKKLVKVAVDAGADAIKFQTFKAELVASSTAPKAEYQLQTTNKAESQLEMLKRLELSIEAYKEIKGYCQELGAIFISTPFDEASADLLSDMDVQAFKIGSGEVTSYQFLRYVACKGRPIILSTGMSYLSEVDEAVRVVQASGCDQLVLLHCVSNYPADPADANLRAMKTMAAAFGLPVGYSDHTIGFETPLAAVALGACVIEKHITLDKTLPGPDQRVSLEPNELQDLVAGIRTVELAMGHGTKEPARSEEGNRQVVRRSLAAAIDIPKATVLEASMLTLLRPASGIPPNQMGKVVGLRLRRPLKAGDLISWDELQ
jgi:N,N'-diacetyllegionaminate synthase